MLYHLLYPLTEHFSAFNVFRYITFRAIYAVITALMLCLFLGPWFIRRIRALQVGQYIRKVGPAHQSKAGTPTMGGILIIGSVAAAALLWEDLTNFYVWVMFLSTGGFFLVGFVDDWLMQVKKRNKGLSARSKFFWQVVVAAAACTLLYLHPGFDTRLTIPFLKGVSPDLGWGYIVFGVLVIVGTSNAVNLTDGLDGLAIGAMAVASVTYMVFAYVAGHSQISHYLQVNYVAGAGELSIFCGALVGASLGFLWFNANPASIFMGDVGSLPLGAALGTVAVATKQELALLIVGGLFVVETLSVIIQVAVFKITGGKRVLKMAPLHHHFEKLDWAEQKITVRFWIIAIILALFSVSTLKLR
ncbi:MAG: phospho-N-acetylmuramoyl-pentapeptide-transferase [Deltaproteobacteria bacterium]|nr:phospho-N-acetylmuramoyl-pentapeptide-transferase [Deltaproteobacteria bacterium]